MSAYICWNTTRSVNFETYYKLLIGRRFFKSESNRPGILRRGETGASFQLSGNCPDVREQLIIRVMTGSTTSRQETTSDVGAGSKGQDLWETTERIPRHCSRQGVGKPAIPFPSQPPHQLVVQRPEPTKRINIWANGFDLMDKELDDIIWKNRFVQIIRER